MKYVAHRTERGGNVCLMTVLGAERSVVWGSHIRTLGLRTIWVRWFFSISGGIKGRADLGRETELVHLSPEISSRLFPI